MTQELTVSASPRRYAALWFPFLAAECWLRERGYKQSPDGPIVFAEQRGGTSRVVAGDRAATRLGLTAGMTLADARARVPRLCVLPPDREADTAWLHHLADRAGVFTPTVALDAPEGLALDLTGCLHFHADEPTALATIDEVLRAEGAGPRAAIGSTPDMARALARFGPDRLFVASDNAAALELPVVALEATPADSLALKRAGLRTLGDLAARPSILFTARFGAALTVKLGRCLGHEDRRLTPRRPPPAYVFDYRCPEPIARDIEIMGALDCLVQQAVSRLEERGEGARALAVTFFRTDGRDRTIDVGTGAPSRNPRVILRLYQDRLDALADSLDPGFGYDAIRLTVTRAEPLIAAQVTLDARDQGNEEVIALCDRLAARFGPAAVHKLTLCDAHLPESTQKVQSTLQADGLVSGRAPPLLQDDRPRPVHLFAQPHPIEVESTVSHEPLHFRWRRRLHPLARTEGPERIAAPWWQTGARETRDYWRVETDDGRRYWLFRRLTPSNNQQPPPEARWFLHGAFP